MSQVKLTQTSDSCNFHALTKRNMESRLSALQCHYIFLDQRNQTSSFGMQVQPLARACAPLTRVSTRLYQGYRTGAGIMLDSSERD